MSGENDLSWDAGLVQLASIGDRAWNDTDADGVQDVGETGKAGVTVELYACVGDLPAGAALATTLTDANGNYSFTGLLPGDYIVKFIAADGSVLSTANQGVDDAADSDAGAGGFTGCYELSPGEYDDTADAGFYQTASLGDYVWVDSNNDGQQNDGNTGLNGVTVKLYTGAGVFVTSTVTATNAGNDGYYLFSNLVPGDYKVEFVKPSGYAFAKQDIGADGSDSDVDTTTGLTVTTTLLSGENDLSWGRGPGSVGQHWRPCVERHGCRRCAGRWRDGQGWSHGGVVRVRGRSARWCGAGHDADGCQRQLQLHGAAAW